ncbi:MAG TPA: hypothetical protein VG144_02965 [Gaiellaceae bacterium]|nr:hypothetical protein [Gaiellaceae bacterium]
MEYPVVEHRATRAGRWLRDHRLKVALWIAVVEAVLVVLDQLSGWLALGIAGAVLAFYVFVGRSVRSDVVRQLSWIAALSQVLVALVPVLVIVIGTIALVAVALLAIVALVALLSDRR